MVRVREVIDKAKECKEKEDAKEMAKCTTDALIEGLAVLEREEMESRKEMNQSRKEMLQTITTTSNAVANALEATSRIERTALELENKIDKHTLDNKEKFIKLEKGLTQAENKIVQGFEDIKKAQTKISGKSYEQLYG